MLLATLGVVLLGNMLMGKGLNGAGYSNKGDGTISKNKNYASSKNKNF